MTEVKVEDVAVDTPKKVVIDVVDGQLSVNSDTSIVDTLMMLNNATQFVLERALVNTAVAEEEQEEE